MDEHDPFITIQPEVKAHRDAEVPDVIPLTLVERLLVAVEKHYGPLPPASPASPVTGASIRADCRFCAGRGCLNCDTLAEAEYRRQFPQGAQPIATFDRRTPEDMDALKNLTARLIEKQENA